MNLRLTPGVTFTRLPHGGAVVVNARTLAVAECGETEADFLGVVAAGVPPSQLSPALSRLVEELVENEWLIVGHQSDRGC